MQSRRRSRVRNAFRPTRRLAAESLETRRLLAVDIIQLADFGGSERVFDFDTFSASNSIQGNEPALQDFGVQSLSANGSTTGGQYGSPDVGSVVWSDGTQLRIVSQGTGSLGRNNFYTIQFVEDQTKFGVGLVVQSGDFNFAFSNDGQLVDGGLLTPVTLGTNPDIYFESSEAFDQVVISPTTASTGYGIADLTLSGNTPPEAVDDVANLDEDTSALIDFAANDSDVDGALVLENTIVTVGPSSGTVELVDVDGSYQFQYTPDANFFGADSFTYQIVDDAGATATAEISVTVNSVIDAVVEVRPFNGDATDTINIGTIGYLPVAIMSTQVANGEVDDFDVTQIDWSAASFQVNGAAIDAVLATTLFDVDGDGDSDLLLLFSLTDLREILTEETTDFVLSAEFGGAALGMDLSGSDGIEVRNRRPWWYWWN